MPPYVPPESLDFDFGRPYTVPNGDDIEFRLYNTWESEWSTPWRFTIGAGTGYDIVPDPSFIKIALGEGVLEKVISILPEASFIKFTLHEGVLEAFNAIVPDPSFIKFTVHEATLEKVISILPEASFIKFTLHEGVLEEASGFWPDQTFIKFSLQGALVEKVTDILPEASFIKFGLIPSTLQILPDILPESSAIKVTFGSGMMRKTEAHHLPTAVGTGAYKILWRIKQGRIDVYKTFPWNKARELTTIIGTPFRNYKPLDIRISVAWRVMMKADHTVSSPFTDFNTVDRSYSIPYVSSQIARDIIVHSTYNTAATPIDHSLSVPYKEPGAMDKYVHMPYRTKSHILDHKINFPYKEPGPKDRHYHIPYGPAGTRDICTRDYLPPPGDAIIFDINVPIGDVDDGININTYFEPLYYPLRCLPRFHKKTGRRDTSPGPITVSPINYPIPQKVYYMLNSVLVKELTTNKPIEILNVNVTTDRNSWLWQFSLTVASGDCLQLLKPLNGVFATIVITINGWEFYCTVEGWTENRRFGKDSWTIVGRSHSLMFGDPISPKITRTEGTAMQGEQLFNNVVTGKVKPVGWPSQLESWTVNWDAYTNTETGFAPGTQWWVPANTLSYTNKTEIEVMKDILGGIGAYVQTNPNSNEFIVKPLFAHQPWNWTTNNSSINYIPIIEDQFKEVARSYAGRTPYHAVHVMGESEGGNQDGSMGTPGGAVFVDVRRQQWSTSTASYSPMVTGKFVTSTKAALEMGRMIIGASGEWINHTLKFGTLCPPGSVSMGLMEPGTMLSIYERGVEWQCQVTGTSIQAEGSGSGMFSVSQSVQVEQFIGE